MYRTCSAKDCDRIIHGRSTYCLMHRKRLARHGDANYVNQKHIVGTLQERFDAKYRICADTKCWIWTGGKNKSGYGTMAPTEFGTLAHRISYGLHVGPIPEGEGAHGTCVCHKCDNAACVNPDHLFLGSNAENMLDRDSKGRHRPLRGSANGHSRLAEAEVQEIRQLLNAGIRQADIAERFGVSQATISDIKLRRIWSHVE